MGTIVALLVGCGVVLGISCHAMKRQQIVEASRYVTYVTNRIGAQLAENLPEDASQVPASFPRADSINDNLRPLENIDPFDLRSGQQLPVRALHYRGGRFDLKVEGAPLKYLRLRDGRAILYSLGPNRRDDSAGVLKYVDDGLTIIELRVAASYDPTNGVVSAGDIGILLPDMLYY